MSSGRPVDLPLLTIALTGEHDIVLVRQRGRAVAELLGFNPIDQTRIATAVSEVARAVLRQRQVGRVRYLVRPSRSGRVVIIAEDTRRRHGRRPTPSTEDTSEDLWSGRGLDLAGRLMDVLDVREQPGGNLTITLEKDLPPGSRDIDAAGVANIGTQLAQRPPESLLEELHQQHEELLALLDDLNSRQEVLENLNAELQETNRGVLALYSQVTRELDDTNRGVLALYAQLDDQANELQRLNALKNQFLSHLSHEFRTPLNSTLALSRLLIAESDGPLNQEQQNQVRFIHQGATELLGMVNDLLDLAKIEAGRLQVRSEKFKVETLFSALRGLFRPLVGEGAVRLEFPDPPPLPTFSTDQGKLAQILRNLIMNALKFTVEGEVTVTARSRNEKEVEFEVRDTGIGIEPEAVESIFEEYVQLGGPLQGRGPGTGLGLPLSAKLAGLLGGRIAVQSTPGVGSVFSLVIPVDLAATESVVAPEEVSPSTVATEIDVSRPTRGPRHGTARERAGEPTVLLIDDDPAAHYLVKHLLAPAGCHVVHATTGREGLEVAPSLRPDAIILDLGLPDISGLDVIAQLKGSDLEDVPIVIYTSRHLSGDEHRFLSNLALKILQKDDPALEQMLTRLGAAIARASTRFETSKGTA